MLITLYTPVGIVYQKFEITENDIIYNDLIKYIHLPKHELYDELDELDIFIMFNDIFVKTIINLFFNKNFEKINLDNKILCDSDEFTILFNYDYYIYYNNYYKKLENNIKNCNNIIDVIKNNPYQIIFIENNNENYYEICKLAIQQNGNLLKCIKPELMNEEICKLAIEQNSYALQYVKPELMTYELCTLAVQQDGCSLQFVKPELMNEEICKLAVQQDGYALQLVKPELMTDEMCKLAVSKNGFALKLVKPELMTEEICKLAVQQNGFALQFVKPEFMTYDL
jgi:hypothetical protein